MSAVNTVIPTETEILSMPRKKLTDSLSTRLTSIGKTKAWLKDRMAEKGMKPRISSNSPSQIVEMFKMIEEERESIKRLREEVGNNNHKKVFRIQNVDSHNNRIEVRVALKCPLCGVIIGPIREYRLHPAVNPDKCNTVDRLSTKSTRDMMDMHLKEIHGEERWYEYED